VKKLNEQTSQAIAYAQDAISFLFLDPIAKDIEKIYLYGSAVRGQLQKGSDIDIFIDTNKNIEKQAKTILNRFYLSQDYEKWKHYHFTYPFSFQAGKLLEWELKSSILAEGILLYSKQADFSETIPTTKRKDLFILELPKNKKRYLHFIRHIFGRKEKGYSDKGFLHKLEGQKLSSNIILIPKEQEAEIIHFLHKEKINYSFKEISVWGE